MFSARSAAASTSAPPTTSEWPPMYFVVECTTTSAPSASGCCRYGDANVLSTTSSAPASCAMSARAEIFAIESRGLVGVARDQHVIGRPAHGPQQAVLGGHPGGESERAGASLERGQALLERAPGRVRGPGVLVALDPASRAVAG